MTLPVSNAALPLVVTKTVLASSSPKWKSPHVYRFGSLHRKSIDNRYTVDWIDNFKHSVMTSQN